MLIDLGEIIRRRRNRLLLKSTLSKKAHFRVIGYTFASSFLVVGKLFNFTYLHNSNNYWQESGIWKKWT
ncbi:Cytochrome P450 monooxygenase aclB [Trichinella spiralis]|uniref:Cytochrome P450 monooxygenase aclB n=1 Tax=Trichinella spiralis TaxID=6334 RepID=A0ABR3KGL0_TRISP